MYKKSLKMSSKKTRVFKSLIANFLFNMMEKVFLFKSKN